MAREKSNRVRAEAVVRVGLARFVQPIDADDWESNPINSLSMELRRTIGAIRYCEEKIAQLGAEHDLVWGVSKSETSVGTVEDKITDSATETYEAKVNIYEVIRMENREHLLKIHAIWINAKLDARKLEIEQRIIDRLDGVISSILIGLGHSTADAEVRKVVRESLLTVAPQLTGAVGTP